MNAVVIPENRSSGLQVRKYIRCPDGAALDMSGGKRDVFSLATDIPKYTGI